MKTLQLSALALALALASTAVQAQQEIDPDHFDRPAASATHNQISRTASARKGAAHHEPNVKVAGNHPRQAHRLRAHRA